MSLKHGLCLYVLSTFANAQGANSETFLVEYVEDLDELSEVEKYLLKELQGNTDNNQLYSYPACAALWDYKERESCCLLQQVGSQSACYYQLSNLPIYASLLANQEVEDPDALDKEVLSYVDAIAQDTDYGVPETKISFVKDFFLYSAICIGSLVVFVTLVYWIVTCYWCRKCKCMPIFLVSDKFETWNVKKGVYEPNPQQTIEIHHLGEKHH